MAVISNVETFLAIVGVCFTIYAVLRLVAYLINLIKTFGVFGFGAGRVINVKSLGKWAVITGATDGIGKAYAQQLAAKGMNIVLVSRNPEKLENVAAEIELTYKVSTKTVVIDFTTDNTDTDYGHVMDVLSGTDIGILVNNAGMSYSMYAKLTDLENREKFLPDIIKCNVLSVIMMTNIVVPGMVKRKRGAVINISSSSAYIPIPAISVYSATKASVDFFTRALQTEYKSSGIISQSVLPNFVSTNMYPARTSLFVPSASHYVTSSLATLGRESRTTGYFLHEILRVILTSIPESWLKKKIYARAEKQRERMLANKLKKAK